MDETRGSAAAKKQNGAAKVFESAADSAAANNLKQAAAKDFETTLTRGRRAKWIRRTGSKRRFRYLDPSGAVLTSEPQLERIKALVIPPAWRDVRICPSASGNLQAIGVDAKGRVQYRYNAKFSAKRQAMKFAKLEEFGRLLPNLRRQTNEDITLEGYPKNKVLAVMIRLINDLYIRVGSEKSVEMYKTFGVTTLLNRHMKVSSNGELLLDFVGKHSIRHRRVLVDQEIVGIIHDLKSFGGAKLFNYLNDDGKAQPLKPQDVNNYIKQATAANFSAKDFRTWGATVLAASELAEIGAAETKTQINKNIVRAVKVVAERLGNTATVARNSYIHPAIIESYEQGVTINEFRPRTKRQISKIQPEYLPEEVAVINLLQNQKSC